MDDETIVHPNFQRLTQAPDSSSAEKSALLPDLNTPYKASGWAEGEINRLVLIHGKEGFAPGGVAYTTFQYVHLDMGEFSLSANAQEFRFTVSCLQPKRVRVQGRNLLRIYDYISLHRMPWIRQSDRDFHAASVMGKEPVITRISIEDWKPEPHGGAS